MPPQDPTPSTPQPPITWRELLMLLVFLGIGIAAIAFFLPEGSTAILPALIIGLMAAILVYYFLGGTEGNEIDGEGGGWLPTDNLRVRLTGSAAVFVVVSGAAWFGIRTETRGLDVRPEPGDWVALDVAAGTVVPVVVNGDTLDTPRPERVRQVLWRPRLDDDRLRLYPANDSAPVGRLDPGAVLAVLPPPALYDALGPAHDHVTMHPGDGRVTHDPVPPGGVAALRENLADLSEDFQLRTGRAYLDGCRIPFTLFAVDGMRQIHADTLSNKTGAVFAHDGQTYMVLITESRCRDDRGEPIPMDQRWARFFMVELNMGFGG